MRGLAPCSRRLYSSAKTTNAVMIVVKKLSSAGVTRILVMQVMSNLMRPNMHTHPPLRAKIVLTPIKTAIVTKTLSSKVKRS